MKKERYAGISPFTSEQRDIFFGRDSDIVELYEQVRLEKQVVVYARSGVGKSSLMNAGVLPQVEKEEEYLPLKIRFSAYSEKNPVTPLERINQALQAQAGTASGTSTLLSEITPEDQQQGLWYTLKNRQLQEGKPLILVFDQFEELFTYPDEQIHAFKVQLSEVLSGEVPQAFVDLFARIRRSDRTRIDRQALRLLNARIGLKAVYIIRSDRLSQLNRLRDRIPDIQKSYYELLPLTEKQAREAIVNPAQKEGDFVTPPFDYEEDALNKIIERLTDQGAQPVETTQLQIVCQRIEQNMPNCRDKACLVSTKDIPNFKNIFFDFYNDALAAIPEQRQENARKLIEDELIRNRQRISLDGRICTTYIPEETLQTLVNSHLLRAERNTTGDFNYELSHDTLIAPIHEAAEKRRQKEEEERAEAERQEELRIAKEKQNRQRKIIAGVIFAALISIGFAVFGFVKMREAKENEKKAVNSVVIGKKRDAQSYIDKEKYKVAIGKYKELLGIYEDYPDYDFNRQAVHNRISKCRHLDSLSTRFYSTLQQADSLSKTSQLGTLIQADSLYSALENMQYEPGNQQMKASKDAHNVRINQVIAVNTNRATTYIEAGKQMHPYAREILTKILALRPQNTQAKQLINKL